MSPYDPRVSGNIIKTQVFQILFTKTSIIIFWLGCSPRKSWRIPKNKCLPKKNKKNNRPTIFELKRFQVFLPRWIRPIGPSNTQHPGDFAVHRLRGQLGLPYFRCHESTGTLEGEIHGRCRLVWPVDFNGCFFGKGFWRFRGGKFYLSWCWW